MSDDEEKLINEKPKVRKFWADVAEKAGLDMKGFRKEGKARRRLNAGKSKKKGTVDSSSNRKLSTDVTKTSENINRKKSMFSVSLSFSSIKRAKSRTKTKTRSPKISLQFTKSKRGRKVPSAMSSAATVALPPPPTGSFTEMKKPEIQFFQSSRSQISTVQKKEPKSLLQRSENKILRQFMNNASCPTLPSRQTIDLMTAEMVTLKKTDPNDFFSGLELIQKTKYYRLFKCYDLRANKKNKRSRKVAVKMIKVGEDIPLVKIYSEISAQTLRPHANVIRYYETFLYEKRIFMVMEVLDFSLKQLVETSYAAHKPVGGGLKISTAYQSVEAPWRWEEELISFVCRNVLCGLHFLHTHFRIHRDIKSENILIDVKGRIKISEFALATIQTRERKDRETPAGTLYWIAPEIIYDRKYSTPADIWSFGILLLEMCQGRPPLFGLAETDVVYLLKNRNLSPALKNEDGVSDELLHFMNVCLNMEPEKRPRASDLLLHNFVGRSCDIEDFVLFINTTLKKSTNTNITSGGSSQLTPLFPKDTETHKSLNS